ncbi:Transmembrane and TPR repeat-containing protein 4, partial [Operophtera brumata]
MNFSVCTKQDKLVEMIYLLFGILSFSTLPYLFSIHGDFVFDDSEAIVKNKDVHSDSWTESFSNDFWGANIQSNLSHKSYRPLTLLSFRLNYFWSGQRLVASHFKVTNILCHSICCVLVWFSFQVILNENNFTKGRKIWTNKAYLSTLLFCVHPVHVESVSGIVGRADVLAAVLFFLAFLMYHKATTSSSITSHTMYLLSTAILSGLSMLSKENGITILGFCIIYEFSKKFKRKSSVYSFVIRSFGRVSFLLIAAICLIYGRWSIMGGMKPQFKPIDNPAAFAANTFTKVITYNYVYFLNILLLIWPQWLCYDWSMGCVPLIKALNDVRIMFVALMYLYGVLVLRALTSRSNIASTNRHIILAVSLIVVPFLPAANIFYPVGFVVAERVLYIPSAGFCLLIVIGLGKVIDRRRLRKIGLCLYCLLLVIFTLKSWHRSLQWRNEYRLFTSALSVCPLNAKVHYNVAKAADTRQQTAWALEEYKEAIRLYPEYYQAMNNLANLQKNLKQYAEAELYLRKAISHKDDFPAAWMNLGIVLANTKRYEESRDAYHIALKYRKNYPDCYYNLGNLNLELNQNQNAMDNWFEAINLNPKHNLAWTNLLALLDNTGVLYHRWKKYKLAQKMYENALKIDPSFRSALQNLKSVQKNIK